MANGASSDRSATRPQKVQCKSMQRENKNTNEGTHRPPQSESEKPLFLSLFLYKVRTRTLNQAKSRTCACAPPVASSPTLGVLTRTNHSPATELPAPAITTKLPHRWLLKSNTCLCSLSLPTNLRTALVVFGPVFTLHTTSSLPGSLYKPRRCD